MPDFSNVQTERIQYLSIAACAILIVVIIELIRRGRLREEYAFVWLGAAVVFLALSIWRGAFDAVARLLGIAYAPSLLILVVLFFGFVYLLHFSVTVSRLTSENKRLAQELAMLAKLVEERKPKDGTNTPLDSATAGRRALAIVPAFNESECIAGVIGDLRRHVPDCDIVVVDDHSTDDTAERVRACGAGLLRLPFNVGIGGAVQTGFRYARRYGYRYAFQFDGDGQHPADEVDKLLGPLRADEADVVIGSRFLEKKGFQSTALRRVGIRLFQRLSRMTSAHHITDTTSGFRAYSARAISYLADNYPSDYPEVEAITLLSRRAFRIVEVPVSMRDRQGGVSSISTAGSFYYLLKVSLASLVSAGKRRG